MSYRVGAYFHTRVIVTCRAGRHQGDRCECWRRVAIRGLVAQGKTKLEA